MCLTAPHQMAGQRLSAEAVTKIFACLQQATHLNAIAQLVISRPSGSRKKSCPLTWYFCQMRLHKPATFCYALHVGQETIFCHPIDTYAGVPMPKIWINAGELSGDIQGAALLQALQTLHPDLQAFGMGGPNLARAGQKNLLRVEELSVMGIAEVLTAIPRAVRMLGRIKEELERLRPDAVVLVDAPEFNFRVAKIAYALGIPAYYFIPPKVWAWRTGRVEFLKRHIRRMFCILPFEPDFYAQFGIDVDYVGNPLVDLVDWPHLKQFAPLSGCIGLMPGSRRKEVENLMPAFGETARILLNQGRNVTFRCLRAPNMSEARLRELWPSDIPILFTDPDRRYLSMRACECILAASGTAVLETALVGVPTIVAYRVSEFSALVARRLIKINWVSLPNLIMNREIFPELLQEAATPDRMAAQLALWLDNPDRLKELQADLEELRDRCGKPGSAHRAACKLLDAMELPISEITSGTENETSCQEKERA